MSIVRPLHLLVTGGCGFIGSQFVRDAVQLGHQVIVLDALTYAGHRENLDGIEGPGQFELVVDNICKGSLIFEILSSKKIDAVIHFAAESHVDRSINSPGTFIETNIVGTFQLLKSSLEYWKNLSGSTKSSFRLVHVSTDEVFGSLGATGKFNETTPMAPNSPYSASKAGADLLVRAWHHTYGLPTVTTNCSNNYGPRQYPEKLVPHMIHCALNNKPLPVYGDGGNIRDWIHVEDHSKGVMLALESGEPGSTYCFGGNAEKNNLAVVQAICARLDHVKPRIDGKSYQSLITFVPDRLGHDRRYAIDDSRARAELGFTRKYDFDEGLAQTIHWYLENSVWTETVLKGSK